MQARYRGNRGGYPRARRRCEMAARDVEADDKIRGVVYPQIVDTARAGRRFITRAVPADQPLGADATCHPCGYLVPSEWY